MCGLPPDHGLTLYLHRKRSTNWMPAAMGPGARACPQPGCADFARWQIAAGEKLKALSSVAALPTFARISHTTVNQYHLQSYENKRDIDESCTYFLEDRDRWTLRSLAISWDALWTA